jgi:predicted lipoprotein with Yx(FWY)xxD motif
VKRSTVSLLAPLIVALLAGCGSSSSSSTSSSAPASAAASTTTAAKTTTAATSTGPPAVITTKKNKLGTVLASGPRKMTVYLFEADHGTTSACMGKCAEVWPPVTTGGSPHGTGRVVASILGTVKRPDGSLQVTYKGHPLYFFKKDGDAGDAYGQGSKAFGAGWYVLAPSGAKIDNS